jgi:hypothetical protein
MKDRCNLIHGKADGPVEGYDSDGRSLAQVPQWGMVR